MNALFTAEEASDAVLQKICCKWFYNSRDRKGGHDARALSNKQRQRDKVYSRATHSSAAVRMQDDSGSCSEFDERVTTKRTESSDYAKSTLVRKRRSCRQDDVSSQASCSEDEVDA